jgi:phage FluMu protein gp41
MLTQKVMLTEGVEVDKVRHKEAVVRMPIVQDSIDAQTESDGKGPVHLTCALIAKTIIKLGTLPREAINAALIGQLNEVDFERLNDARELLKKKAVLEG